MKIVRLFSVFFVAAITLLCVKDIRADVFAHNIRITQPNSSALFDGKFNDGTGAAIRFVLSDKADTVTIAISSGSTIVKKIIGLNYVAGDTVVVWDGTTTSGSTVTSGVFNVTVTAANSGYSQYTLIFDANPPISTRGVTTIKNPALKNFGFIYAASSGDEYATGVARHSADGTMWGDVKGAAKLTTTGLALGGANARYSSEADNEGFVYVIGRDNSQILRYSTDSLNVTLVDTGGYSGWNLNGLGIRENNGGKFIAVVAANAALTDSKVFGFELGANAAYFGSKSTVLQGDTSIVFWDVVFGRDNKLYATYFGKGDNVNIRPGIAAFNYTGTTLHMKDTLWTSTLNVGRGNTASYYFGSTPEKDILYFTIARRASGDTAKQNIYYVKNLTTTRDQGIAYVDPQNNLTQSRSDIAVDAVGNVVYFENSNEETAIIAPPFGRNSYTTASLNTIQVFSSEDIAKVKIDANNDNVPDRVGDTVTVVGVVNSVNFVASANRFSYSIQDATGGIVITKASVTGGGPVYKIGYRLSARGVLAQYNGTTQIVIDSLQRDVKVIDSSNTVTPISMDIETYLKNPEYYESMLIKINGVAKTASSVAWPAAKADANMTIWDGYKSITLRIDQDTDIDGQVEPVYPINVTGVATQYATTAPYNTGYQITPNAYADIEQKIALPPSKYFNIKTPANNSVIKVDSAGQTFSAVWNKSIDLNGDAITYQFNIVKAANFIGFSSSALSDTTFSITGKQILAWLGVHDTLSLKWTVKAKGSETETTSSIDTFNITFVKGNITDVKSNVIPREFYVEQNYPNPFNPSTTIKFGLPAESVVDLRIYNVLGQEVAVLLNKQNVSAGTHSYDFNASKLASGTYIYRLQSGSNIVTKKMLLMK